MSELEDKFINVEVDQEPLDSEYDGFFKSKKTVVELGFTPEEMMDKASNQLIRVYSVLFDNPEEIEVYKAWAQSALREADGSKKQCPREIHLIAVSSFFTSKLGAAYNDWCYDNDIGVY